MKGIKYSPNEVRLKTKKIYENVVSNSNTINSGNFLKIQESDLKFLFEQYDCYFFSNGLSKILKNGKNSNLSFKISKRMTRAAGKTILTKKYKQINKSIQEHFLEIRISSVLLYQSFSEVTREIYVNGLLCKDRLEALQRIFEHEIIHLLEMLLWGKSSCSNKKFLNISNNIFSHKDVKHQLITQNEIAMVKFNIRVGDYVSFNFKKETYNGIVNRINKRATILVEDMRGRKYSNGKYYMKYYIPISQLEKK